MADGYGMAPAKDKIGVLGLNQAERNEKAKRYEELPIHCFTKCLCGESHFCDYCGGSGKKVSETNGRTALFL